MEKQVTASAAPYPLSFSSRYMPEPEKNHCEESEAEVGGSAMKIQLEMLSLSLGAVRQLGRHRQAERQTGRYPR